MKLIIEIPKEEYDIIKNSKMPMTWVEHLIANGTPLPKGHGRLIDADNLLNQFPIWVDNVSSATINVTILKAPTIIEADKAESEDV